MIWLTWRQARTQTLVAAAALAVVAVTLLVTGLSLVHLYDSSGLVGCTANCDPLRDTFLNDAHNGFTGTVYNLTQILMFVVPPVIGVFWGAPLMARELESGTYRLVWNQSVTRNRWLAVKLAGLGLLSTAVAGLLSLAVGWWAAPVDRVSLDRLSPGLFTARGVVPLAYAAFAFVLGVVAGMLIRRTVPAMAVTLVVVAAAQILMPTVVRAHLIPPVHTTVALDTQHLKGFGISDNGRRMEVRGSYQEPGAWVLNVTTVRPDGTEFTGPANQQVCNRDSSPKACMDWVASLNLKQSVTYQPASRFWPLQWAETGLFAGLAALLALFCFWWVRRRLS
jgi:ABC-type transport system involved in multi-copper enzyme maturation permease subunit